MVPNQFLRHFSFPFYGSLPLNYDLLPSFGQKRRSGLEAVRNAIGHSLRVRKSQQSMRDNSFSHALRVRRGRQWDAMGHTLRFERLKQWYPTFCVIEPLGSDLKFLSRQITQALNDIGRLFFCKPVRIIIFF